MSVFKPLGNQIPNAKVSNFQFLEITLTLKMPQSDGYISKIDVLNGALLNARYLTPENCHFNSQKVAFKFHEMDP